MKQSYKEILEENSEVGRMKNADSIIFKGAYINEKSVIRCMRSSVLKK